MLIWLPEIDAWHAVCQDLLSHFAFIVKSSFSVVDKWVLAALGLMSLAVRATAGDLKNLTDIVKEIWRPLPKLRRFTWVANELQRFLMNNIHSHMHPNAGYKIGSKSVDLVKAYNLKETPRGLSVSCHVTCFVRQGKGIKVELKGKLPKVFVSNKKIESIVIKSGAIFCGGMDGSVQQINPDVGSTITIHPGVRTCWAKKRMIYALKTFEGELYAAGLPEDGIAIKVWNIANLTLIKGTLSTNSEVQVLEVNDDFICLGTTSRLIEVWLRERLVRVAVLTVGSKITSLLLQEEVLYRPQ